MTTNDWFYIRSTNTGNVVSASTQTVKLLRSQVLVTPPTLSDHELWCWDGQFLRNKATNYVLDIRKGRLRLIEDTEICLYTPKPLKEAHNQLWSVREASVDIYGRPLPGFYIYSLCSNEWVLDVQQSSESDHQKLVLFPLQPMDTDNQRWLFVPEGQLDLNIPIKDVLFSARKNSTSSSSLVNDGTHILTPPASISPSPSFPTPNSEYEYPQGLTPAKRGSHSSVFSMDALICFYSDKGLAMATAYHIFQKWKLDQISQDSMTDFPLSTSTSFEVRSRLQTLAQDEVHKTLSSQKHLYSNNNAENASTLSSRLITQLYDQTPISP
ncbi:MAG: hypothetical protein EXX96DRAFT_557167 [Benjaminiella poitrasii]|nr:MAG: hypothetical protein EXX96DRAFT_557167 [Benjaminiella poitrasii]